MPRDIEGITRVGNVRASKNEGSMFESSQNKDCRLLSQVFEGDPPHLSTCWRDLRSSYKHRPSSAGPTYGFYSCCCGAYIVLAKILVSKGSWYEDIQ